MISDDSWVVLSLTSRLGAQSETDASQLTLREWNNLLKNSDPLLSNHPGELLHRSAAEIQTLTTLDEQEAARIIQLLQRVETVRDELEQLAGAGIRVMTRYDQGYPTRYLQRLGDSAPLAQFYAGEPALLEQPGVAVVGSRNVDQAGQDCAAFIGNSCGLAGMVLYSGGARGVDTISMRSALEVRGCAVGILADSLLKTIQDTQYQAWLKRGDLCLATPYIPSAGFSVGAAMGRNRLIYCLADYAIVVACEAEKGGTWAGANEALKAGWVPVFALKSPVMPDGNRLLIEKGAVPFPYPFPESYSKLPVWLSEHSSQVKPGSAQLTMF